MRLSWNEIRVRAKGFADAWADAAYEKGETQSFYNALFHVFGKSRRSVATYEEAVKKLDNRQGFIDLFWRGTLLVEQKSKGRDLGKARDQAFGYIDGLKDVDKPRYILLSDFQNFDLINLSTREETSFKLCDLHKHVEKFGFIIGVERRSFQDQDPVNIKAAELVGKLHDELEASGFTGHDLEVFLVRLVFCLFADDTGVFPTKDMFLEYLETRTSEDGTDMRGKLSGLFEILNTKEAGRNKNEDQDLLAFPYINGSLFEENTRVPPFNSAMRDSLIEASRFDWSPISPAIFGSLFQSVMNAKERRAKGAHYTTEKNIMKVIGPLFLDELWAEFKHAKTLSRGKNNALDKLSDTLGTLTFFDPACGCGNFLIIAYREIRRLETDILKARLGKAQLELDAKILSIVDVDQFYGIELEEFPARIAETAMWMMDHIMNNELSLAFGQNFARIPLDKAPHIHCADALELDWADVLAPKKCTYILGNPPFIGHQWRTKKQQAQMHKIWGQKGQVNRLDYVTCWFKLAVEYSQSNKRIKTAFVATNSISQGEQASILWPKLFALGVHIFFAHRTFQWSSEARGKAAVHCVVVGLSFDHNDQNLIFEYADINGEPSIYAATRINGYLIDAPHVLIAARGKAPDGMPPMHKGSQPTDGARLKKPEGGYQKFSNLILDIKNKVKLLEQDPTTERWLRPYVGGDELISGHYRWCLWLKNSSPKELRQSAPIMRRLERVKLGRLQSPTPSVREFANFPTLFTQDRQPNGNYIAVPEVSSESREYIPISRFNKNIIASNKLQIIPNGELWLFSLLTSAMHMGWMRTVTGRLESRYSYAPTVYNTFPWPALTDKAKETLAKTGQAILDARAEWPEASLADLYDPDAMPANLRRAHIANDKAVDKLYRSKKFDSERERVEHLFALYEQITAPMLAAAKPKKRRARARKVK